MIVFMGYEPRIHREHPVRLFLLTFLVLVLASLSPTALLAQSESDFHNAADHEPDFLKQTGTPPKAGDVYTLDNLEEVEPWISPFYRRVLDVWGDRMDGVTIKVSERKTVEYPESYARATRELSGSVQLKENHGVSGYKAGMPFPMERMFGEGYNALDKAIEEERHNDAGRMILWNSLYRPQPNAAVTEFPTALTDRYGNVKYQGARPYLTQENHRTMNYPDGKLNRNLNNGILFRYMPVVIFPASAKDVTQLLLMADNIVKPRQNLQAFAYLPSLRRVVPLSGTGSAHCAPTIGTDYYIDDLFGFAGIPRWFNKEYLGRVQYLVPFDPPLDKVDQHPRSRLEANFNAAYFPNKRVWNLRDFYVIQLTPNEEHSDYCYSKKRLYMDVEAGVIGIMENFDKEGKPWKLYSIPGGASHWNYEGTDTYYGVTGFQSVWDLQAKHGTWSANSIKAHATKDVSSSDLTPTGLLKVVK